MVLDGKQKPSHIKITDIYEWDTFGAAWLNLRMVLGLCGGIWYSSAGVFNFFRPRTPKLIESWSRDPLLYIYIYIYIYIYLYVGDAYIFCPTAFSSVKKRFKYIKKYHIYVVPLPYICTHFKFPKPLVFSMLLFFKVSKYHVVRPSGHDCCCENFFEITQNRFKFIFCHIWHDFQSVYFCNPVLWCWNPFKDRKLHNKPFCQGPLEAATGL